MARNPKMEAKTGVFRKMMFAENTIYAVDAAILIKKTEALARLFPKR